MPKIILNNGAEYSADVGFSDGILWVWMHEPMSMLEAFTLFSNSENTQHMVFSYGSENIEYDGFTQLTYIAIGYDGNMNVALKRGVEDNV